MIIYAENGNIKKAITDDKIRAIKKENFHPMTRWMLDNDFLVDCVQIKVPFLGDEIWINVRKNTLTHVGRKSMAGWLLHGKSFTDYVQPGERVTSDIIDYFQGVLPPKYTDVEGPFFMVGEHMAETPLGPSYITFATDPTYPFASGDGTFLDVLYPSASGGGTFLGVFSKAAFKLEVHNHPEWLLNKWE